MGSDLQGLTEVNPDSLEGLTLNSDLIGFLQIQLNSNSKIQNYEVHEETGPMSESRQKQ